MAFGSSTRTTEDTHAQIARLREQVEALMKDRVTPAMSDFAGRAESMMHGASDAMRHQSEAVSSRVRDQPLVALAIAIGVGWVIGRIMR
ncbi:MAG: hypothetical protein AB7F35_22235 [Acetobacteraceae bacterium]